MFYLKVHFTKDYEDLEKLQEKHIKAKEAGQVLVVGTDGWEIVCDEDIFEEIKSYCRKSKKKLFIEGEERLAPYVIVDPHKEEGPPVVAHIDFLDMVEEEKLMCGLEINPTEAELWEAWEDSVVNGYGDFPSDEEAMDLFDFFHEDDCEGDDYCCCIDSIWENMREKFTFSEAHKRVYDYCSERILEQDF